MCTNRKPLKKVKIVHKYKECGLDNVILVGVERYHCDQCGEDYFGFSNMQQLHDVIARILLQKRGLLSGKEVRFLRKHLGYSGAMFGKLIGYEHETISRIETGAQPVTMAFDRLVRFSVAAKMPDRDYDLHDQILNKTGMKIGNIKLETNRSGNWKAKVAA